jgi:long-chain fatty acid transport protein
VRELRSRLLIAAASVASVLTSVDAQAGGFAIREQSADWLGVSFAGVAAGGAPSSLFWNPATMTQLPGVSGEINATGILPSSKFASTVSPLLGLVPDSNQNIADAALAPAITAIKQINSNTWIGLSVNSPWGLSTSFQDPWPGRFYGLNSNLRTYNVTPSIAYHVNNWISVGAGFQAQYGSTGLTFGLPAPSPVASTLNLSGSGWGFGFTAGATLTPLAGTDIGIGYRSALDQKISGTMGLPSGFPLPGTVGAISTTLRLPDVVSVGVKQRVSETFTLLGTVEWTNWSRIGTSVIQAAGGPATIAGTPVTLPFDYRDGWLFSAGMEYRPAADWAVRAGVGYEISPVTNAISMPEVPDANRVWLSVGLSKTILPGLSFDVAYAHVFIDNANINIVPGNPWFSPLLGAYSGTASSHIDIFSVGLRLQTPTIAPPLVTKG